MIRQKSLKINDVESGQQVAPRWMDKSIPSPRSTPSQSRALTMGHTFPLMGHQCPIRQRRTERIQDELRERLEKGSEAVPLDHAFDGLPINAGLLRHTAHVPLMA